MQNTGLVSPASLQQQPQQSPAERFRIQLRSLYDMGFDDEQRSLAALQQTGGNLNRAVDVLLSGDIPAAVPANTTANTTAASGGAPAQPPTTTNAGSTDTDTSTSATATPPSTTSQEEADDNSAPKDATDKKND